MSDPHLKYNNAAGRVLSVLEVAMQSGFGSNSPVKAVWSQVFGISEKTEDFREFYKMFIELGNSVDDIETQLRVVKGDEKAEVYLRSFPPIKKAFCPLGLNQNWRDANPSLNEAVLTALELCAVELPDEGTITSDEILAIKKSLDELYTQIKDSQLRGPLRNWLLDLISTAKRSLELYEFIGIKAFRKALRDLCGDLTSHLKSFEEVKDTDESIYSNVMALLNNLKDLAQRAKEWEPLLEYGGAIVLQLPGLVS
jgi:hypothetical protein